MTRSDNSGDPRPETGGVGKPSSRWVKVALVISLAFNLAIVGIVVGGMLREGGAMEGRKIAGDLGFGPFTEALSKQDRAALRRAFLSTAPDLRDARRARQADFSDLLARMRAVPFDADALRDAFERQNTRNSERLQLGQRLIYDLVVGMTDTARQEFASRLEVSLTKGPNRVKIQAKP